VTNSPGMPGGASADGRIAGTSGAALSQTQIIRSLGEALTWFEKELDWGVAPPELNHLTGRIGKLYAAMITRGQMALAVNQRGYDVVSGDGERISVKTVTTSVHVGFNRNTLALVDRIMVLRINVDYDDGPMIEPLLDIQRAEFNQRLRTLSTGAVDFPIPSRRPPLRPLDAQQSEAMAMIDGYRVEQFESGTISVSYDGQCLATAKPMLRVLASRLAVDLLNGAGRPRNTRQLGAAIIKAADDRQA